MLVLPFAVLHHRWACPTMVQSGTRSPASCAPFTRAKWTFLPPTLQQDWKQPPLAEPIAKVAGLRWKIWSLNEATSEFAGIYLFDDADSVQVYLAGPIIAQVSQHPALGAISAKQFGAIDEFSAVTRGPA